ncbi:DUF924 family protein [Microdochium nivale]|nr:DUF924 family protein [Microdochium nivale]
MVRFMLGAVFVHHERARDETRAFIEEARAWVEARSGVTDLHRAQMDKAMDDLFAFLYDEHFSLLNWFGLYPYRNGALGRTHTPKKEVWMAE